MPGPPNRPSFFLRWRANSNRRIRASGRRQFAPPDLPEISLLRSAPQDLPEVPLLRLSGALWGGEWRLIQTTRRVRGLPTGGTSASPSTTGRRPGTASRRSVCASAVAAPSKPAWAAGPRAARSQPQSRPNPSPAAWPEKSATTKLVRDSSKLFLRIASSSACRRSDSSSFS